MKQEDIEELSSFFAELQRETDRGLPLVSASLIDEKLRETLEAYFCSEQAAENLLTKPNAPLGTFSARIDACLALGLIDDHEYREISLIRKIRNMFAHSRHGLSFANERVMSLCASFESELPSDTEKPSPRYRFTNATVCLIMRLFYRDKWVALAKRQPMTWVKPEDARWRSFKTEAPSDGAQYVAIGPGGASVGPKRA